MIANVVKSLATSIENGQIPPDLSTEQILEIVERDGIEVWANKEKSPYIE